MSAREFLEKKIIYRDGNAIYIFFSSIPDDYYPCQDENVVRAYGLIGFQKYERQPDGKILYESIMQTDLNAGGYMLNKLAQAASMSALPGKMAIWYPKLTAQFKYMEKYKDFKFNPEDYSDPVDKRSLLIAANDETVKSEF